MVDEAGTSNNKQQQEVDGEESERPVLRYLKATRWVMVILLMVITVAAIARALVLAFRPIDLYVRVACGFVTITGGSSSSPDGGGDSNGSVVVAAIVTLHMCNPSGRDGLRLSDATFELLVNSKSTSPGRNSMFNFPFPAPAWVGKELISDVTLYAAGINATGHPVLYDNGTTVGDAAVKIEGRLQRRITGLRYTKGYRRTYYCWPVTVGHTKPVLTEAKDVYCNMGYIGEGIPPEPACLTTQGPCKAPMLR